MSDERFSPEMSEIDVAARRVREAIKIGGITGHTREMLLHDCDFLAGAARVALTPIPDTTWREKAINLARANGRKARYIRGLEAERDLIQKWVGLFLEATGGWRYTCEICLAGPDEDHAEECAFGKFLAHFTPTTPEGE